MNPFKRAIVDALVEASDQPAETFESLLEVPRRPEMGDYAIPCFPFAKTLRKNPAAIAGEWAEKLELPETLLEAPSADGPFLNFRIRRPAFAAHVLEAVRLGGTRYGESDEGQGERVPIDFSSPNIAKPFGIGHLRSTVIGACISRLYEARGYTPVGINHLGDWGTQFGMVIAAHKRWGSEEELTGDDAIRYALELYVRFNQEMDERPELRDEARDWFKRIETGDSEAHRLWERFKEISLAEFRRIYDLLGVSDRFDSWSGESFYNDKISDALDRVREKGLLEESEGAQIVDLEKHGYEGLPPALLVKADGATLYMTRDLSAALYRQETYRARRLVYVVGKPQELHFRQLFALLELLDLDCAEESVHVSFGHYLGMSTRKGTIVFLEDVLEEAMEKAKAIIREKNPDLEDPERIARAVGVGAVIFFDLKDRRTRDIQFDLDRIVSFEGDTGPYLQNAHVRMCGILRKWDREGYGEGETDESLLVEDSTFALLKLIEQYPTVLEQALETHEPHLLSNFLLDLAAAFHGWYHECQVIGEDERLSRTRLELVKAARQVLKHGLRILGVEAIERM